MSQGFAQPPVPSLSGPGEPASVSEIAAHLQSFFSEVEDPRVERTRDHSSQHAPKVEPSSYG